MTTYVLGGGCFWCLDAVYRRIRGVSNVETGYAGGETKNPSYYEVENETTEHAQVVRISFDESIIPGDTILDLYFLIHDPTTPNRQGADVGSQYRSIMLYADEQQKSTYISAVERAKEHWGDDIVTQVEPLEAFYKAEDEHQDYFNKNPATGYCSIVIAPKIVKARSAYKQWFKEEK
jgi:peptide-methionine (S)-S-oxide reductase